MALIDFAKYHGLGNDFIIINDYDRSQFSPTQEFVCMLCDRNRGIGADGILVIKKSLLPNVLCRLEIFNADGSRAAMCGNGLRCVLKWYADQGFIASNSTHIIETDVGIRACRFVDNDIEIDMGFARYCNVSNVGVLKNSLISLPIIDNNPSEALASAISIGNNHLVVRLPVSMHQAQELGSYLEKHYPTSEFNIGFVNIINNVQVDLIVWERGAGITKACGSGACAAVAMLCNEGLLALEQDINVNLPGGTLVINALINRDGETQLLMRGPAAKVFNGCIEV